KKIERISVLLAAVNIGIWSYSNWEKLTVLRFLGGVFSMVIAYGLVYLLLKVTLESFAKKLLIQILEDLTKNHNVKKLEKNDNSLQEESRDYTAYLFIGLLVLDGFALYKLNFSVL